MRRPLLRGPLEDAVVELLRELPPLRRPLLDDLFAQGQFDRPGQDQTAERLVVPEHDELAGPLVQLQRVGLDPDREEQLKKLAETAGKVVGVKGWARVDVFIDQSGQSQLIEINTVPGMTDHSLVPMAAKQAGIDFDDLAWRILETSLIRD